jgi:DNA-binding MarR family transcriptional regulator
MIADNNDLICEDIMKLLVQFKTGLTKIADTYGLTNIQTHALYILDHEGSIATGKVATALHCDASNVTGIIDRLVLIGLVERHEDLQDRRAKKLKLSTKGKNIIKKFSMRLPDELGISKLSNDQTSAIHEALQMLLESSNSDQTTSELVVSD